MRAGLRARLRGGEAVVGTWLTLGDPTVAEIMAQAGYAFLVVDLEHSPRSLDQAAALIRTAELAGSVPLVRLSAHDPVQVKRVMDAGAHGVIVPMCDTREQLAAMHAAMHYPPTGTRGVGLARAQAWGEGFEAYRAWLAEEALLVAQVEHAAALPHLDALLSFPGLDAVLIGPYDLSASLGLPGQLDHPRVAAALAEIEAACARHGVPAGIHQVEPDPVALRLRLQQGYRFVAYGVDFRMLAVAAREGLRGL